MSRITGHLEGSLAVMTGTTRVMNRWRKDRTDSFLSSHASSPIEERGMMLAVLSECFSKTEGVLMTQLMNVEQIVQERYAAGARQAESALCCPVTYEPRYLAVLPQEIIEKDYGCGDPSQYLRTGETVLDLGCGTGKICYIAAQIVGPSGRVIGVDMTPDMLALAAKYREQISSQVGFHNVELRRGKIQDLRTDL